MESRLICIRRIAARVNVNVYEIVVRPDIISSAETVALVEKTQGSVEDANLGMTGK